MTDYRDPNHLDPNGNFSITQLVKFIREKMFGIDVRESIAKALEKVYEDASKEGNANMEVSQARGFFDTLVRRLNNSDETLAQKADRSYVDAVLSSIASGGPKELFYALSALRDKYPNGAEGTYLVFDTIHQDSAHSYMWNGSIWEDLGPYQGLETPDKSIGLRKLEAPVVKTKLSDNLCRQENIYWDKFPNYNDGNLHNNNEFCYVKAPINPSEEFLIIGTTEQGCFLDSSGNYISGYKYVENFPNPIPSNAATIMQTFRKTQIEGAYMGPNTGENVAPNVLDVWSVKDQSIPFSKSQIFPFLRSDFNAFNKNHTYAGKYIYYENGLEQNLTGYRASMHINIDSRTRWEILGTDEQLAYYDGFGRYIGGLTRASQLKNTSLPENARTIRITLKEEEMNSVILRPVQQLNNDWITESNAQKVASYLNIESGRVVKVKKDGTGDFVSLRAALENADFNATIEVYDDFNLEDEYTEAEMKSTSFEGYLSRHNQTIKGIGNVTLSAHLDPNIYSYDDIQRVSTITSRGDGILEDLTVIGRSVRYAFHPETHADNLKCVNCHFIKENEGTYCQAMAGGTRSGQEHIYENCTFETKWTGSQDIPASYHTNVDFDAPSTNTFIDCAFISNGSIYGLRFGGMASGQTNIINLIGNRLSDVYLKEEVGGSGSGIDYKVRGRGNRPLTIHVVNTNPNIVPTFDFVEDITVL